MTLILSRGHRDQCPPSAGDDNVFCFRPDNCSVTIVDIEDCEIKLVEPDGESVTHVGQRYWPDK